MGLSGTIPTGRYIDLVVTMGRNGVINTYVDGTRVGGGTATTDGITGCTARPLRFERTRTAASVSPEPSTAWPSFPGR